MKTPKIIPTFISEALANRESNNQYRSLTEIVTHKNHPFIEVEGKKYVNFSSNDYLGLSSNPQLIKRAKMFLDKHGAGSSSSRLITGTLEIHSDLESKLAEFCGTEAALIFNSGFQANTSILAALADRNSLILADKQIHNSLIQGAVLSRATFKRYKHNNYSDLEQKLKEASNKAYNRIWIVSESLFSMDGDIADISELSKLANKYEALLYVDDAHAVGVTGKQGRGLNFEIPSIDITIGTFGKAFGSFGAYVACSNEIKEYLINFCSGFIYSTALPPQVIGAIDAALDLIPKMDKERETLNNFSNSLRKQLNELGFNTLKSNSHIIPVVIGDETRILTLSNQLKEKGMWVSSIRPPTVEQNASRLRITLTVNHSNEQITKLIEYLATWKRKQKF